MSAGRIFIIVVLGIGVLSVLFFTQRRPLEAEVETHHTHEDGTDEPLNTSTIPADVAEAFRQLSDSETPVEARLNLVKRFLSLFADNAQVMTFGAESGETLVAPVAVQEYMERIAFSKSLDRIEVIEVVKNDVDSIQEVHLIEYYK